MFIMAKIQGGVFNMDITEVIQLLRKRIMTLGTLVVLEFMLK